MWEQSTSSMTHNNTGHCLSPKEYFPCDDIPTWHNIYLLVVALFSTELCMNLLGRLCACMLTVIWHNIALSIKFVKNDTSSVLHHKLFNFVVDVCQFIQPNICHN